MDEYPNDVADVVARLRDTRTVICTAIEESHPDVAASPAVEFAPALDLVSRRRVRASRQGQRPGRAAWGLTAAACVAALAVVGAATLSNGVDNHAQAASGGSPTTMVSESMPAPAGDWYYTKETQTEANIVTNHPMADSSGEAWIPVRGQGQGETRIVEWGKTTTPMPCGPIGSCGTAGKAAPGTPAGSPRVTVFTCAPKILDDMCGWDSSAVSDNSFDHPTSAFVAALPRDLQQFTAVVRAFAQQRANDLAATPLKAGHTRNRPHDQLVGDTELQVIEHLYRTGAVDASLASTIARFLPTVSAVQTIAHARNLAGQSGTGYYVPLRFDFEPAGNAALVIDHNGRYIGDATVDTSGPQRATTFEYGKTFTLGQPAPTTH
ncbi:MAG: hypothetical protein QOE97_506 [Pseudonocardiales bacterium]|nr:hypothetical protein [Pseudonocardiales bacterium]